MRSATVPFPEFAVGLGSEEDKRLLSLIKLEWIHTEAEHNSPTG